MARDDGFFSTLAANGIGLRAASSFVMIAAAAAAFSAGYWAVCALVIVLSVLMLWEYDAMLAGRRFSPKLFFDAAFVLVPLAAFCMFGGPRPEGFVPAYAVVAVLVAWFCFSMLGYILTDRARWILESLPPAYVGLPMLGALYIYAHAGTAAIVYIFIITASTDTGALLIGTLLKGPKLAPSISPKKTWSGAIGGVFCAFVFGTAFQSALLWRSGSDMDGVRLWALASVLLSVLAQAGDLFESKVKRIAGIKDSSNLIPGHGGVLDRFDSFLFVAPVVALLLAFSRLYAPGL